MEYGPRPIRVFKDACHLKKLGDEQIAAYFRLVNPLDKAGSYAIQEHGDLLVEGIQGLLSMSFGCRGRGRSEIAGIAGMRALLQRVTDANVKVDGENIGSCGKGLLILLGVCNGDTRSEAAFLAEKCLNLRIFSDDEGKMNRSLLDIQGGILVISQFTLYADTRKGRRPSFVEAAVPEVSTTAL